MKQSIRFLSKSDQNGASTLRSCLSLAVALTLSIQAFAADVPLPQIQPPAGFDEGTETTLSPAQMAEVIPWAQNSEETLRELLKTTQSFEMRDAHDTLLRGIKDAVLASAPKHTETLMRYVLNRAIKTDAIIEEQADVNQPGVIDIQVRILRGSINMALKYYKSDLEYLNGRFVEKRTNLTNLPYAEFGWDYADFLMTLNQSIIDASAQYSVAILALGLFQWDLYRDQDRLLFSSVLAKINTFLKTAPAQAPQKDEYSLQWLRRIKRVYLESRGNIRALMAQAKKDVIRLPSDTGPLPGQSTVGSIRIEIPYQGLLTLPNGNVLIAKPQFVYGGTKLGLSSSSNATGVHSLLGLPQSVLLWQLNDQKDHSENLVVIGANGKLSHVERYRNDFINSMITMISIIPDGRVERNVRHGKFAERTEINTDRTATIIKPLITFPDGNTKLKISKETNLNGACRFYGYSRAITYSTDDRDNVETTLVFSDTGFVSGARNYANYFTNEALTSLTCE